MDRVQEMFTAYYQERVRATEAFARQALPDMYQQYLNTQSGAMNPVIWGSERLEPMKQTCDYCGGTRRREKAECPNCGAPYR